MALALFEQPTVHALQVNYLVSRQPPPRRRGPPAPAAAGITQGSGGDGAFMESGGSVVL